MTQVNADFARNNQEFNYACKLAKVEPTRRQVSKFRNKKGRAYKALKRS